MEEAYEIWNRQKSNNAFSISLNDDQVIEPSITACHPCGIDEKGLSLVQYLSETARTGSVYSFAGHICLRGYLFQKYIIDVIQFLPPKEKSATCPLV